MEKYSKRYISMKETNPDIAERMPDNAETALYNTLFTVDQGTLTHPVLRPT